MEQIYTIPVNEAFDASAESGNECPFCRLFDRLEENELTLILGASMMEPDVRLQTNKEGFCRRHYTNMFHRKNRLGLGLILESHLGDVAKGLSDGGLASLVGGVGAGAMKHMEKLEASCYVCRRIEGHFARMAETVMLLYREDGAFRKKLACQPFFCLPHYRRLLTLAKSTLGKQDFAAFYHTVSELQNRYLASLTEDVSWFCKKFDYRYADEPWNNAKDAPERALRFLTGNEKTLTGGEKNDH